jgi:hypothetical protein
MHRKYRFSGLIIVLLVGLLLFPLPVAARGFETVKFENPLLRESAALTASPQTAFDSLGYSVAISGNVVVAGAPYYTTGGIQKGAAFVYQIGENGWEDMTQVAKLSASDAAVLGYFGYSVAMDGDTIIIGAYGMDSSKGKAYVFVKPAGGWQNMTETAILTPQTPLNLAQFGYSVSISGDTIAVGANGENTSTGAVYVFNKPGGGWSGGLHENARLTASDGLTNDRLGAAVSIDGSTIVAGAIYHDLAGISNSGAVYLFEKPVSGWVSAVQTAKLSASDKAAHDWFGAAVSLDGDTLAVGADNKASQRGAAYIFIRPPAGWVNAAETAILDYSMDESFDHFGRSVSVDGESVLVGADGKSVFLSDKRGAAMLYLKPVAGWVTGTMPRERIYADSGASQDQFGFAVDHANGFAVAGAPMVDGSSEDNGAVFVFSPTQVYYNPDGVCYGNAPCFDVFAEARAAAAAGQGVVSISGMILEDVLINKDITVNIDASGWAIFQGKLDIQQGHFVLTQNLQSISDLTLGAGGSFDPLTYDVMLSNRGLQTVTGNFNFYSLSTDPTAVVDVGSSLLTISDNLSNGGSIKRSAPPQAVNTGGGAVLFLDAVSGPAIEITSTAAASLGNTAATVTMGAGPTPELCHNKTLLGDHVLRHYSITPQNTMNTNANLKLYFRASDNSYSEYTNIEPNTQVVVYGCGVNGWQALSDSQVPKPHPGGMYYYVEANNIQNYSVFAISTELAYVYLPLTIR